MLNLLPTVSVDAACAQNTRPSLWCRATASARATIRVLIVDRKPETFLPGQTAQTRRRLMAAGVAGN